MERYQVEELFEICQYAHKELFADCTYAWEALALLHEFLTQQTKSIECPIPEGAYLVNPEQISIGKDTIVEPGAFIKGPCIIGNNCEIRHGAYIRGNVLVGDGCVIGHCIEIKNSILLDEVSAGHFNYVGDSILGNRVNLGAGTKLANLRLDHENVIISGIQTNLKKLGAIIGDGTQLGCNVVTNPGTIIGKEVFSRPNLTLRGYIPPKSRLKTNQKTVVISHVDRNCV